MLIEQYPFRVTKGSESYGSGYFYVAEPGAVAADMTLEIRLKMTLMLLATPGMTAPEATATNPAMRAYSIRSCPRLSIQIFNIQIPSRIVLMVPFPAFAFAFP
jgi:hypothetical protein